MVYSVVRENRLTRRLTGSAVWSSAIVTLAVALGAVLAWSGRGAIGDAMSATAAQVFKQHQWWRAWTTLLVHGDLHHLLANSLLLFVLGIFLFGHFGSLIFPGLAFLTGGLVNLIVLPGMPANVELIGASGVVYWMAGFWLTLYFLLDSRYTFTQRGLRAGGVALGVFMPTEAFDPNISYACHFWGFALGVAMALAYFVIRRRKLRAAEVREFIFEPDFEIQPTLERRRRHFV